MSVFLAARCVPVLALALFLAGLAPSRAHEGHDHGAPPPPLTANLAPRGEAASEAFELVAILRGGALTLFLDRFRTAEPIADATVEIDTPEGPRRAEPMAEGSYRLPAPWLRPGRHDLVVTVTAGEEIDVLPVSLTVPEPAAETGSAASPLSQGGPRRIATRDPVLLAVASGSFLLGLGAMLLAVRRRRGTALALVVFAGTVLASAAAFAHGDDDHDRGAMPAALSRPGEGAADLARRLPDGAVFVPKPTQRLLALRTAVTEIGRFRRSVGLPGRVIPNPNASGVVQSSVGGRLSPPASGLFPRLGSVVAKGEVLASVTPPVQRVDVSDMRQRQGELDQQIAIVKRRVERYARLAQSGAVAQVQYEEAQDELKGLQDRRAALDAIRAEPEPLIAPVDGVIAEASATAGQMAAPGQMVFRIVDPKNLWVEALSFDALIPGQQASARLPDGRSVALTYQGAGLADRNQAIPVQFAIQGDTAGLRLGQFLTVLAATDAELSGLALPRAAVVRTGNGQDVVYEHVAAERYEARPVRVDPLDGERVLVAGGLGPGRRVVVQGAELLDQVR
ncbi:efflux RND transporter periplasmic adaptor subunit [Methylobacterium organophilum]|uniref:Multidrug resistance protein MdtA n=1 Tax=Methylobacterium organophilum TaxID=410 RepID=A0ABQ4T2K2_METOR|nr:efflux RND transporter periplasmic adaptor subunit [Methylobacterium organophilum]GJE25872.1 Multidrug resistance protein MdtA [Methylobacterium organophilum]